MIYCELIIKFINSVKNSAHNKYNKLTDQKQIFPNVECWTEEKKVTRICPMDYPRGEMNHGTIANCEVTQH